MPDDPGPERASAQGGGSSRTFAILETPISELMQRDPPTVDADVTVRQAMRTMHERKLHHLLVEDRGEIRAIVSDRDLLRATSPYLGTVSERERDVSTIAKRIGLIASHDLVTIRHNLPMYEAAELMQMHDISSLPVVGDDGTIVGLLTLRGLFHAMLRMLLEPPQAA